jgi:hypothetical protein
MSPVVLHLMHPSAFGSTYEVIDDASVGHIVFIPATAQSQAQIHIFVTVAETLIKSPKGQKDLPFDHTAGGRNSRPFRVLPAGPIHALSPAMVGRAILEKGDAKMIESPGPRSNLYVSYHAGPFKNPQGLPHRFQPSRRENSVVIEQAQDIAPGTLSGSVVVRRKSFAAGIDNGHARWGE